MTEAGADDVIMVEGGRQLSLTDVRRESSLIKATRRMSDPEIEQIMHSATAVDVIHHSRSLEAPPFVPSEGLTTAEAEKLLAEYGRNELEEKVKPKWKILLEQFTAPMPIMIWIAMVIEAALQNWPDFGILTALQFINGFLSYHETTKAGDAVAALKATLKPVAHANRDGKWIAIDAAILVPGDLVLLGSGSAVPADCFVNHGQIDVDQAALTGESLPVTMGKGDSCKMGSTVVRGEVEGTVEATGKNTFFGKTAALIQSVDEQGHLQKVLLGIMYVLVSISFLLCAIVFIYLMVKGESFHETISFVVVLLVASIPIAMEVVTTTTLAIGSRKLAEQGAIVTRLGAIEEMAGMNMLCSDKTGTLTLNKMVIQEDCPTFAPGVDRDTVILMAALAAKWKEPPKDALDTMVLGVADLSKCDAYEQIEYVPFDPAVKRTAATLVDPDGKQFEVTKGAPHVVLNLCHDKERIQEAVDFKVIELAERGIRSLAVARTDEEGKWCMLGIMTFLDPPRPDTKHTIEQAMHYGVDVKMITGDHQVIAKETARQLGMGDNIMASDGLPSLDADGHVPSNIGDLIGDQVLACNGFASVFPEHKFLIVEALRQRGFAVGMTGDGVNDAPALKKADIGIAVSGATDAARAAADIVLTQEGLAVVVDAIIIARCIFARMKSFIIYRVACTFQLLIFFFIAVLAIHPYDQCKKSVPAVELVEVCGDIDDDPDYAKFWSMPVTALILITILNDGTIISISYDNVKPNNRPEVWNMKVVYTVSLVLGLIACVSSLLLLVAALESNDESSFFYKVGMKNLSYGEVQATMYLKISLSDFLTLFASRQRGFFWTVLPGKLLFGAFCLAVGLSTLLSAVWPFGEGMEGISGTEVGWVWLYCIIWFLLQDAAKVFLYKWMIKTNYMGINNTTSVLDEGFLQGGKVVETAKGHSKSVGLTKEESAAMAGRASVSNSTAVEHKQEMA